MKISALNMLIKQADPKDLSPDQSHPERNRGINDNNPLARHIYKNFGWIEPHPQSYLGKPEDTVEYNKQTEAARKWLDDNKDASVYKGYGAHGVPELWDFYRQRGAINNSYRLGFENVADTEGIKKVDDLNAFSTLWLKNLPPQLDRKQIAKYYSLARRNRPKVNTFDTGTIIMGSYPHNGEKTFLHEFGHEKDLAGKSLSTWQSRPVLDLETTAWDLSGIPEGDPVREAALDTYRAAYMSPEEWSAHSAEHNITGPLYPRLEEAAATHGYAPPSAYMHKYSPGVPVVHDYASAKAALDRYPIPDGFNFSSLSLGKDPYSTVLLKRLREQLPDKWYITADGGTMTPDEYEYLKTDPQYLKTGIPSDESFDEAQTFIRDRDDSLIEDARTQETKRNANWILENLRDGDPNFTDEATFPLMIH